MQACSHYLTRPITSPSFSDIMACKLNSPRFWNAVHSNNSPVTFHFVTELLDVAKTPAGVALLLVGMVAVAGHVTSFSTGVAKLLPLLLRLLAVPGDVTTLVAVVARWKGKVMAMRISSCCVVTAKSGFVPTHWDVNNPIKMSQSSCN